MTPRTPLFHSISSLLRPFTKGLAWGIGICILALVLFTGYWVSAGATHVATGDPLTNATWNGLVDVVNNLQNSVSKLATLKANTDTAAQDALVANVTCTEGWAWVICYNPLTGKWYYDNSSYNQIYNGPYTNYPTDLKSPNTICTATWWPYLVCFNPVDGNAAWNGSSYSAWASKPNVFMSNYPFQGNPNLQCFITGTVNIECIDPTTGQWAYIADSWSKWTYWDASDTWPSNFQGRTDLQCQGGWANMICFDKTTGAMAWTGSKPWSYWQPQNYPDDFTQFGDVICGLSYPNVVCMSPHTWSIGWISASASPSATWNFKAPPGFPFGDVVNQIQCNRTGYANFVCVNPHTGVWAYLDSSYNAWAVKDFSASYPPNLANSSTTQCNASGWPMVTCTDPKTGEWAYAHYTYTGWIAGHNVGWNPTLFQSVSY